MLESSRQQTQRNQDKVIKQLEALPNQGPCFTSFDDEMIVKFYPTKGSAIAKLLGKNREQVRHRAQALKVKYNR